MDKIISIVNNLRTNPVFNMSLSSKELFHSNVLAWLFESKNGKNESSEYANKLKELFKPYDKDGKELTDYSVLTVLREKKNFDILIVYKNNNDENDLYYVIVENKFKAIPEEKQLDKYAEEICGYQRYSRDSNGGKKGEIKASKKKNGSIIDKKLINITDEIKEAKSQEDDKKYEVDPERTTCYLLAPENSKKQFLKRVNNQEEYISQLKDKDISQLEDKGISVNEIHLKKWTIITYEEVCAKLKKVSEKYKDICKQKLHITQKSNEQMQKQSEAEYYTHQFIEYYTEFVGEILKLCKEMPAKKEEKLFPDKDILKKLKTIRIHDFYEKYWYSTVMNLIVSGKTVEKSIGYSNGTAMLNFWYHNKEKETTFGIEIQSRQFRFFVFPNDDTKSWKEKELEEIEVWLKELKDDWLKSLDSKEGLTNGEQKKLCKYNDFKYVYQGLDDNCTIGQVSDFLKIARKKILEKDKTNFPEPN